MNDGIKHAIKKYTPRLLFPIVKEILTGSRHYIRKTTRKLQHIYTVQDLTRDLQNAGIHRSDTVMVHSALSQIGNVQNGAITVIESLMEAVGPEGTVLMPVFGAPVTENTESCSIIDLRTAKSKVGSITEAFRAMPGVKRSSHPFTSISAWGKHAEYLTSGHQNAPQNCHADSPLGRLHQLGGKILGLGIDMGTVSFYHVPEDNWPDFPLPVYDTPQQVSYIDQQGNHITREILRYRKERSGNRIDQYGFQFLRNFMAANLNQHAGRVTFRYGKSHSWWVGTEQLYNEMVRLGKLGITIYISKEELDAILKSR
jgi:aminoglycoside 3-N-acetyltransferase